MKFPMESEHPSEYDLSPPNDGTTHLGELKWGRESYEWLLYHPNTFRSIPYWTTTEKGHRRIARDWRLRLPTPDPWALRLIAYDPEKLWCKRDEDSCYIPDYQLWNPDLFQNMMIEHRPFLAEIRKVLDAGCSSYSFRSLYSAVGQFFRSTYREKYQPLWQEEVGRLYSVLIQRYATDQGTFPTWDQHWVRSCKFFDESALLVAQFLVRHYTLYQEHWSPILVDAVDLSHLWNKTEDPMFQPSPDTMEFLKPGQVFEVPVQKAAKEIGPDSFIM